VQSLIEDHRKEIGEHWLASEKAKIGLSFGVTLAGAASSPLVTVKLGFSKKFSDEASIQLSDINQAQLPI
jgi:hypothetical protein